MSVARPVPPALAAGALALAVASAPAAALAAQRPVTCRAHNYDKAPVLIKQTKTTLIETYGTPTQTVPQEASVKRSRVQYANRAGLLPTTYELKGEALLYNGADQAVEAVGLTVVLLDAFHEQIQPIGRAAAARGQHQFVIPVPKRTAKTVTWQTPLGVSEIYEVVMVVTRVRFADGTVWAAPAEEVIDVF
jgi:hypothetical protein